MFDKLRNTARRTFGGDDVDRILALPMTNLRLELKKAFSEKKFTQEQYDDFTARLLKLDLATKNQADLAGKAIKNREVNSEMDIELDTPAKQILWAAALTRIMDRRPDIVVSGINHGANLGDDVTYSGTVAGAFEAAIFRLPGIAVSLTTREGDFSHAAGFAARITERVLREGIPTGTILNVNVPPGPIRGARLTHQGKAAAESEIIEGIDPRGKKYYWIGVQKLSWKEDPESDYGAVGEGLVSITPLRTDLTDYGVLELMRKRNELSFHVEP